MRYLVLIPLVTIICLLNSFVPMTESSEGIIEVKKEEQFIHEKQEAYILTDVMLKDSPYEEGKDLEELKKYSQITLSGTNRFDYWEVEYKDTICYIDKNSLTTDKAVYEEAYKNDVSRTYNNTWKGKKLSKKLGTVWGPNGRETYYNLNMSKVVAKMHRLGFEGEYWVREDGVKMFGKYIMCAANLDLHPRGSLVNSTLGMCIVCDTGAFAKKNKTAIDIAVDW